MKGLLPHVLPFFAYVAIGATAPFLGPWADVARVLLVAAMLLVFATRGAYPELRERPSWKAALAGVACGVGVGAAWVPLAKLVPTLTEVPRTGLPPSAAPHLVAARLAAMVLVIPIAEELIVRSALPRFFGAKTDQDWREVPVGAFTPLTATISVVFFTFSHSEWLAALATALVWTALLAKTKNLRAVVLSHVVANAWLATYVLVTGETRWW